MRGWTARMTLLPKMLVHLKRGSKAQMKLVRLRPPQRMRD